MESRTAEAREVAWRGIKRVKFVAGEVINPYPDSPQLIRRTSPPAPWDEIAPVVVHAPLTQDCGADLRKEPCAPMDKNRALNKEKAKTGNKPKGMTKTDENMPVHVAHSVLTGGVRSDEQSLRTAHRIAEGEQELQETNEDAVKLRRFEDPEVFKLALELVVRRIGRYGKHISWPNPGVVTMMTLKAEGLPTEPEELLKLMKEAVEEGKPSTLGKWKVISVWFTVGGSSDPTSRTRIVTEPRMSGPTSLTPMGQS